MSRETFEAWAKEQGYEMYRQKSGSYFFKETHIAWQVWSAATASMQVERDQLAAENAAMKADQVRIFNSGYQRGHAATIEGYYVDIHRNDITTYHEDIVAEIAEEQTPATDRFLSDQRAQGRVEGINFAAARVAAAFNHGFIDKPTSEVYDVVKAVLGAKEEIATAPEDGLSGVYADRALNDWAAQLRNEVNV